jgi:ribosomal protein L3 glutamine methyltransferase
MNAVMQPTTIQAWIDWAVKEFSAADLFYGHGTDNSVDEAVYLIAHALHTDPSLSGYTPDKILSDEENKRINTLLKQRLSTKKPAAYLVNLAWFCGLPFYVDERVLVPRSPIAELIEDEFQPWIARDKIHSILEIGTGSGCIALSCAYYLENVQVTAVDIDDDALAVANENLQRMALQDRVKLVKSDVFDKLAGEKYDIIISNPPYVGLQEYADLPAEYKHEPVIGLTSGEDGLDCVRQILTQATEHLNPHGILIVEVGNSQAALEQAFPEIPFLWLEFERGGQGVFLFERDQLLQHKSSIRT